MSLKWLKSGFPFKGGNVQTVSSDRNTSFSKMLLPYTHESTFYLISVSVSCSYRVICKVHGLLAVFVGLGNMFSVLILTVDRYLFISHPLRYHSFVTNAKALLVTGPTFALVLTLSLVSAFTKTTPFKKPCNSISEMNVAVVLYVAAPVLILTVITIALVYGKIALITCKANKNSQQGTTASGTTQPGSQKKVTKVIMLVVGVFLFTYTTYFLIFFLARKMSGQTALWTQTISIWIWKVSNADVSVDQSLKRTTVNCPIVSFKLQFRLHGQAKTVTMLLLAAQTAQVSTFIWMRTIG